MAVTGGEAARSGCFAAGCVVSGRGRPNDCEDPCLLDRPVLAVGRVSTINGKGAVVGRIEPVVGRNGVVVRGTGTAVASLGTFVTKFGANDGSMPISGINRKGARVARTGTDARGIGALFRRIGLLGANS